MLILSLLREQQQQQYKDDNRGGDHHHQMESFSIGGGNVVDFSEFSGGNLLDSIDFDDLFIGIDSEMDVLPDLEMDSDMLADFSVRGESELNTSPVSLEKWVDDEQNLASFTINTVEEFGEREEDHDQNQKVDSSGSGTTDLKYSSSDNSNSQGGRDEIVCKGDEITQSGGGGVNDNTATSSPKEATTEKGHRKSSSSSAQSKTSHGKRKVKVDWTPELHRRFVQAVEQLGVDKAVPSRILELMGIDCLTRHNIASHLQKYRSHRKHLLAREAEAASWTRRRQFASAGGGRIGVKRPSPEMGRWLAPPTMGFPPPPPPPPMHQQQNHGHHHQFRPLHVWGHPTVDQSVMHMWPPKHLALFPSPQPPPPTWPPAPSPQTDTSSSYWHHHHQRHAPPNGVVTPGAPCFPRQITQIATPPATRFPGAPVTVIPGGMYKLDPAGQSVGPHHPLVDFQPSKESIDAAIGDALSKPWLPLPLGLKPPSTDCVMGELQRQGIPNIPPSTAA